MRRHKRLRLGLLSSLFLYCGASAAAQCLLEVPDIGFGNYSTVDPEPADTSALFRVDCMSTVAETVSYDIAISTGVSNSYIERAFAETSLVYNLFTDAGASIVWGDGSNGSMRVTGSLVLPGTSSAMHMVYGRIPAQQSNADAGTFADALIVTLSY